MKLQTILSLSIVSGTLYALNVTNSQSLPSVSTTLTPINLYTATTTTIPASTGTSFILPGGGKCQAIQYRKEWRDHTAAEQENYIKAITGLRMTPSQMGLRSRYDDYVVVHAENRKEVHHHPIFLPWHREFIRQFENDLQSIVPGVMLPYWDWGFDGQDPLADTAVLGSGPHAFGTQGTNGTAPGTSVCVLDGFPANWTCVDTQCLSRDYSTTHLRFIDNTVLGPLVYGQNSSFDFFAFHVEVVHNSIHSKLGGDMGYTERSANDPIFFAHHGNVDRMWSEWQKAHPDIAFTYASGLATNATMPGLGNPISFAMNSNGGTPWCIEYQPFSGEVGGVSRKRRRGRPGQVGANKVAVPVGSGNTDQTVERFPVEPISEEWIRRTAEAMGMPLEEVEEWIRSSERQMEETADRFDAEMDTYLSAHPHASYNSAYNEIVRHWTW